jgi:phage recombination protein Bet
MSTTALAVIDDRRGQMRALGAHQAYLEEKRDLILRTVCDDKTTDAEFEFFIETCKLRNLNPLAKQIYFIRRSGRPTFQTSIDGFRLIASRTGEYAGCDPVEYDTESEEHPNKATCTVYRLVQGEARAFTASARWKEYEGTRASTNGRYPTKWDEMPYLMLGKCAESLALRKAFPEDLSGLYTDDEMDQADREQSGGAKGDVLPSGLRHDQFARLQGIAESHGVRLVEQMDKAAIVAAIEVAGGPRVVDQSWAGISSAIKAIAPKPVSARPVRDAPTPAPSAAPPEPPIEAESREERVEVDRETGEVIPPHVGKAATAQTEQAAIDF